MQIRDRIKELRRVQAETLRPNPRNWRTHSALQRDALRGVLTEVGYAGALLARELADGSLELIDGHLRAEATPDAVVPVLVLDVNEAEAAKLLATFDPLSAMAGVDQTLLDELVRRVETDNAAVRGLLDSIAPAALDELEVEAESPCSVPGDSSSDEIASDEPTVRDVFQVVARCADEDSQRELYERLRGEGYECKLLLL